MLGDDRSVVEKEKGGEMKQEDIEKAWRLVSMHNSELLLENEELKKRLMRQSLWYTIKRAYRIWRGKE